MSVKTLDYLSLAKQAKADGNEKLVMMYAKNHCRVIRKKQEIEKELRQQFQ